MNSSGRVSGRGQREIENEIETYILQVERFIHIGCRSSRAKGMEGNQENVKLLLQTWKVAGGTMPFRSVSWVHLWITFLRGCINRALFCTMAQQPLVIQGLLIIEASRSHSVELLWTRDQPDAETSTWQHTILSREKFHTPGGIWTRSPSKRASERARERPQT